MINKINKISSRSFNFVCLNKRDSCVLFTYAIFLLAWLVLLILVKILETAFLTFEELERSGWTTILLESWFHIALPDLCILVYSTVFCWGHRYFALSTSWARSQKHEKTVQHRETTMRQITKTMMMWGHESTMWDVFS